MLTLVTFGISIKSAAVVAATSNAYGAGTGRIILDGVNCTGTEMSLSECEHKPLYSHNCNHSDDVGVICKEALEQQLLAQVYTEQEQEEFTSINSAVVADRTDEYGAATGRTILDGLSCTGTEMSLLECSHEPLYSTDCRPTDDVIVICEEGTEMSLLECEHKPLYSHNCRHSDGVGVICEDGNKSHHRQKQLQQNRHLDYESHHRKEQPHQNRNAMFWILGCETGLERQNKEPLMQELIKQVFSVLGEKEKEELPSVNFIIANNNRTKAGSFVSLAQMFDIFQTNVINDFRLTGERLPNRLLSLSLKRLILANHNIADNNNYNGKDYKAVENYAAYIMTCPEYFADGEEVQQLCVEQCRV
ncbi:hypothetical protein C0Q70_12984 [Pomacea canaliculata]|uniref:SRCR domain-containing protein n=1 Tax=Pomacea canaliculata TaxID=400727 RepID=A0A2T7P326_POMCA|nr:hypothetical protein C0Q70_12984 [Pomacea canaliculata]